jgi:hypothetical protein
MSAQPPSVRHPELHQPKPAGYSGEGKYFVKRLLLPLLITAGIGTAFGQANNAPQPMHQTPYANQHDVRATGDQYIYYMGIDAHVWQIYNVPPATDFWGAQDVTAAASAPPVEAGNGLVTFQNDHQGIERVVYLGNDLHIHLLSFNASTSTWNHVDATAAAQDATAILPTTALAAFYDNNTTSPGELHVIFQGKDQHIHSLSTVVSGAWVPQDLSALTDNAKAAPSTALVAESDPLGDRVFYTVCATSTCQHTHVFQLSYPKGSYWHDQDLTNITAGEVSATSTKLASYNDSSNGIHVVFEGLDSNIHQFYYNATSGSAGWSDQNITGNYGAPPAVAGSGLAAYDLGIKVGAYDAQTIFYVAPRLDASLTHDVYRLYFNPSTHGWYYDDIVLYDGLPPVESGGNLTGFIFGNNLPNPYNEAVIFDGAQTITPSYVRIVEMQSQAGTSFFPALEQ